MNVPSPDYPTAASPPANTPDEPFVTVQVSGERTRIFVHKGLQPGNEDSGISPGRDGRFSSEQGGKRVRQGTGGEAQPLCFYGGAFPRTHDPKNNSNAGVSGDFLPKLNSVRGWPEGNILSVCGLR